MRPAGAVKIPKRKPHVAAALAYLDACGATDVAVTQKGHLHIRWRAGSVAMAITLSTTPKNTDDCSQIARQMIRRRYREAGKTVPA